LLLRGCDVKPWLTTAELADYLGLSETLIRDSDIPSYRFGDRAIRRYRREDVEKWLAKHRHDDETSHADDAKVVPIRGKISPSTTRRAG